MRAIYTKFGDFGDTRMLGGDIVRKSHACIAACGDIDELMCILGIVREHALLSSFSDISSLIDKIHKILFAIEAELASCLCQISSKNIRTSHVLKFSTVEELEALCDSYSSHLPELLSFIMPCGSILVSYLHLARSITRRAERSVVYLFDSVASSISKNWLIVQYLNRLSDLLFVLCRWCLHAEGKEELSF